MVRIKHKERVSFLLFLKFLLHLTLSLMTKSQDLAIFVPTTTTPDHFTPAAYTHMG